MVEIQSDYFDIAVIADSGQCFRLHAVAPRRHELIAGGRRLAIEQLGEGHYLLDCDAQEYARLWRPYFDLDTDYARFMADIPPDDAFLTAAVQSGRGIRILRQEPWEMLITFIISQWKNITAIKKSVEMLSARYGEALEGGGFAFPTPAALAGAEEGDLLACALGYRWKYVQAAARMADGGALDFAAMRGLDDGALMRTLLTVPGVGPKVANCVMLFGFYRIAAFPRDVWINRIIEEAYGGSFDVARYAGYAGVVQQYMFYHARMAIKKPHVF